MNQGTISIVYRRFPRLLVIIAILLMSACEADEPEHVSETAEKPVQPGKAIQVREWYPTPKQQQAPYYVFAPAPGQRMQQQQIITVPPPSQPVQRYSAGNQPWTPAPVPYPAQQGMPQYPVTGGGGGYGQAQLQQPVPQPQYYQPLPQYQQSYQPVPQYPQQQQSAPQYLQQYQPYYQAQPQYQYVQRPWGNPGQSEQVTGAGTQSMDTWQKTNQFPSWGPPAYNGYTGQNPGQFGTTQDNAVPGYYW